MDAAAKALSAAAAEAEDSDGDSEGSDALSSLLIKERRRPAVPEVRWEEVRTKQYDFALVNFGCLASSTIRGEG